MPVPDACDAADDPAVWVDEADLEASLIVATNKLRGLVVYGLDGTVVSTNDVGRVNNVDLETAWTSLATTRSSSRFTNRTTWTIDVLSLEPDGGALTPLLDAPISPDFEEDPYALYLYRNAASRALYVFANDQGGALEHCRVDPGDTGLTATRVRSWAVGTQTEGCVADDANGWLFIGQEKDGICRYRAEPGLSTAERLAVDPVGVGEPAGGHLASNVADPSIYAPPGGGPDDGFLVASSQGNNTYLVYDRAPPHAYRKRFRLADAGAPRRPGHRRTRRRVGPAPPRYPMGLLVVQDGVNLAPEGAEANQNFKPVPWQEVLEAPKPRSFRGYGTRVTPPGSCPLPSIEAAGAGTRNSKCTTTPREARWVCFGTASSHAGRKAERMVAARSPGAASCASNRLPAVLRNANFKLTLHCPPGTTVLRAHEHDAPLFRKEAGAGASSTIPDCSPCRTAAFGVFPNAFGPSP